METVETLLGRALESGCALRLHTRAGEVLVAQVLSLADGRLRCRVLTSSRPENYAHCDSTGLDLALAEIARAALAAPAKRRRGSS